eukprot:Clim_evm4s174 gene=Clim_evmTU4s174
MVALDIVNNYFSLGQVVIHNHLPKADAWLSWNNSGDFAMYHTWSPPMDGSVGPAIVPHLRRQTYTLTTPPETCSGFESMTIDLQGGKNKKDKGSLDVEVEFVRNLETDACLVRVVSVENNSNNAVAVWSYIEEKNTMDPKVNIVLCTKDEFSKDGCRAPLSGTDAVDDVNDKCEGDECASSKLFFRNIAGFMLPESKKPLPQTNTYSRFTIYNTVPQNNRHQVNPTFSDISVWFQGEETAGLFDVPLSEIDPFVIPYNSHETFVLDIGGHTCSRKDTLVAHNGYYATTFEVEFVMDKENKECLMHFVSTPKNYGYSSVVVTQESIFRDTVNHPAKISQWTRISFCDKHYFKTHGTCPHVHQEDVRSLANPYQYKDGCKLNKYTLAAVGADCYFNHDNDPTVVGTCAICNSDPKGNQCRAERRNMCVEPEKEAQCDHPICLPN